MEPSVYEEAGNENETIPFPNPIVPLPIGRNAAYKDGTYKDPHELVIVLITL